MSVYIANGYTATYGADNPVIGWNSAGKRGVAIASTAATGYIAANALDPMTYNYWRPTALPANFLLTTSSAETFSYCGIAAHNLGSTESTVSVEVFTGGAWANVMTVEPENDSAIMVLFPPVDATSIRVVIEGSLVPTVGVIYFGEALELPHRTYQGYTPIDLAKNTDFETNVTRGGMFAGRTIRRSGASNNFTVNNIPEDWVRDNFLDFISESLTRPFFLAERPTGYPDAVGYMFTTADIHPQRTGPRNLMSITL